jgi:hypothetical protein
MAAESVNLALVAAATLSALAALLHVGCIVFGAPWYRFFGAGEQMAKMAERGEWRPTLITSVIVLVLSAWAAYALSGAGVLPRFPLLRTALCLIAGVYTLRGVAGLVIAASGRVANRRFWIWSSLICLVFGLTHAVGLVQRWPQL